MSESAKEYGERIAKLVVASKGKLDLHDPQFEVITKATESVKTEPDAIDTLDTLLKAYEQPVIKAEVKPRAKTLDEAIDQQMKDYGVR